MQRYAPAAERNQEAVLSVLRPLLPARGRILEVASGSGQHVVAFARAAPGVSWQPSDPDPDARASISAWTEAAGLDNVAAPRDIDVSRADWPGHLAGGYDGILAINLLHIAPWAVVEGLMTGAGALLEEGGWLFLYGPFKRDGRHSAESNAAFDRALKARSSDWGVRDLVDVAACAAASGLSLEREVLMPVNNLSLIFRRGAI